MLPRRILILIFALMLQSIIASNEETSEEREDDNGESNGTTNSTGDTGSSKSTIGTKAQEKTSANASKSKFTNQKTLQTLQSSRRELRLNNGALFTGDTVTPFHIIQPDGKVYAVSRPDPATASQAQPFQNQWYNSSANIPKYPSMLQNRISGFPSHNNDVGLNSRVPGIEANIYNKYKAEAVAPSRPLVTTEDIDQGPLAPAPKSLMELAGWWEYLAILFGDAGDSSALRLILHRLTKLAQLQLQGIEIARVQAATAFLANHFKPLLEKSFNSYVFEADYNRNSNTWSSDPGYSAIIRRLVDQMDYFGALKDLEHIFGPDLVIGVNPGMRQPEWLQLKLIFEQIAWDLRHPNDLIGLWSPAWNLSVPQKLSILAYATNPRVSAPLDNNLPNLDLILARINLISNGEAPKDSVKAQESPLEQAHYKYALLQANGNLCLSGNEKRSKTPNKTETVQSRKPTSVDAEGFKRRVGDYCELVNVTPNFAQFCQSGPDHSTPLSSLLAANGKLFDQQVIQYVNHLERLFWAFTWVGACVESQEILVTVTNQVKNLAPRQDPANKNKRVPSGVSESIQIRLEYMQAVQQTCQTNMELVGSADVAHIFSLLNYKHVDEAFVEWSRRYSNVAARLQGYPGGLNLITNDGQLLFQQARAVRIALLIYKYPKSIYVPCLSKGLLTRDQATDLTLLNLADSLDSRKSIPTRIDPVISEISARSLYMRALYLAGRFVEAAREAREIAATSGNTADNTNGLVQEFLACTYLCGSATRDPCESEKTYDSLLGKGKSKQNSGNAESSESIGNEESSSNTSKNSDSNTVNSTTSVKSQSTRDVVYRVGKELSSRLCRLSRNTAADALSLRYGKVLTTQSTFSAFKRFIKTTQGGYSGGSKLKAGVAESVVPWFASLPPAPVDDILSFVPTHAINFVPQVNINGFPSITVNSNSKSNSNKKESNSKIMVLGKEYSADLLTRDPKKEQNKNGLKEPRIEIDKGIFQLVPSEPKKGKNTKAKSESKSQEPEEPDNRNDEEE